MRLSLTPIFVNNHTHKIIIVLSTVSLTSCAIIKPEPLTVPDQYSEVKKNAADLFSYKRNVIALNYEEALSRGIHYNYDYRIKLVNSALEADQLRVAEMTMFPDIKTSGSLYTRSNNYATSSTTAGGGTSDVVTSTPKTLRSLREGFSWNLLDLGMSYIRAKEKSNRVLIAEEEARKQLQILAQDIRAAYWKAYSAQELMVKMQILKKELDQTEKNINRAMADQLIPKEEILKYRTALLGGYSQFVKLKEKFDKSQLDLKQLLNLPLASVVKLKAPPVAISRVQNIEKLNFRKLDTIAMIMRPELRSQKYMERIAKLGVKATIVQVIPGLTLNEGYNYNSNKYLANNMWMDKSIDLSWSLLNLVSLPRTYSAAQTQVEYENLKSMALTLAVLTQTRYAYATYVNLAKEYSIANKQAETAHALYKLTYDRNVASMASKQQVVYAQLQSMIARMNKDLVQADLSTALGELYLSAGFDVLPVDSYPQSVDESVRQIKTNFDLQESKGFIQYVDNVYAKLIKQLPAEQLHVAQQQKRSSRFAYSRSYAGYTEGNSKTFKTAENTNGTKQLQICLNGNNLMGYKQQTGNNNEISNA